METEKPKQEMKKMENDWPLNLKLPQFVELLYKICLYFNTFFTSVKVSMPEKKFFLRLKMLQNRRPLMSTPILNKKITGSRSILQIGWYNTAVLEVKTVLSV